MTVASETRSAGASQASEVLRSLYADWAEILATTPDLTIRLLRSIFDEWDQPTVEPTDVTYAEETIGGVPGIWATPVGADRTKVLLYTHGGGFAVGSAASHRKLAGPVAKALGVTAFVIDYRRRPSTPTPPGSRTASRSSRRSPSVGSRRRTSRRSATRPVGTWPSRSRLRCARRACRCPAR